MGDLIRALLSTDVMERAFFGLIQFSSALNARASARVSDTHAPSPSDHVRAGCGSAGGRSSCDLADSWES